MTCCYLKACQANKVVIDGRTFVSLRRLATAFVVMVMALNSELVMADEGWPVVGGVPGKEVVAHPPFSDC